MGKLKVTNPKQKIEFFNPCDHCKQTGWEPGTASDDLDIPCHVCKGFGTVEAKMNRKERRKIKDKDSKEI